MDVACGNNAGCQGDEINKWTEVILSTGMEEASIVKMCEENDAIAPAGISLDENTLCRFQTSLPRYKQEYHLFCEWRKNRCVRGVDEETVLAYFSEKVKKCKGSSLWSYHSMLKRMIHVNENVDIGRFPKVKSFLKVKVQSDGLKVPKSQILTKEQIVEFLEKADDDTYLLEKVVLVMGIFGACRIAELLKMSIDDISDKGNVLVVTVSDTKTRRDKSFTIISKDDGQSSAPIDICRKYINLRPKQIPHRRLFVDYRNKKCTIQPVGINKLGKVPTKIAEFLGLPNAHTYTGHCFRRSSAALLAESRGDLLAVKKLEGWRWSTLAARYIEDSLTKKSSLSNKIGLPLQQNDGIITSEPVPSTSTAPSETAVTDESMEREDLTPIKYEEVFVSEDEEKEVPAGFHDYTPTTMTDITDISAEIEDPLPTVNTREIPKPKTETVTNPAEVYSVRHERDEAPVDSAPDVNELFAKYLVAELRSLHPDDAALLRKKIHCLVADFMIYETGSRAANVQEPRVSGSERLS